jgi:DNA-binding NtrC family response regulator
VDDEVEYAPLLQQHLQRRGHEVTFTGHSSTALQLLSIKPTGWDMVLTSALISRIDGVEFVRQVHALLPDMPCMVISHFIDPQLVEDIARVPPCLVHHKPLTPGQVMELVVRARHYFLSP